MRNYGSFSFLDIMAVPCHVQEKVIGGIKVETDEECKTEYEDAMKYLSSTKMIVVYNEEVFQPNEYGD